MILSHRISRRQVVGAAALTVAGAAVVRVVPGGVAFAQSSDATQTRLRVINGSTEFGEIDVRVNNDVKAQDIGFAEASDWIDVDAGTQRVTFEEAGVNLFDWIYDATYPFIAGESYQLILTDQLVIANIVDRSDLAAPNLTARARVIQASPTLPPIDFFINGSDLPSLTNVFFSRVSDYQEVKAGDYTVEIARTGVSDSPQATLDVSLAADTVYDFVVIGKPEDSDHPVQVLQLETPTFGAAGATGTPSS
jgi:Domain of unknown function (DUF4397)